MVIDSMITGVERKPQLRVVDRDRGDGVDDVRAIDDVAEDRVNTHRAQGLVEVARLMKNWLPLVAQALAMATMYGS